MPAAGFLPARVPLIFSGSLNLLKPQEYKTMQNTSVRKSTNMAASVAAALLLAACASSTTPYAEQQLASAHMLTPQQVAAQYQVDTAWWRIYQDEQLNRLVDTALANNVDLKKTAITVEQARYSAGQAADALFPINNSKGTAARTVSKNLKEGGAASNQFESSISLGVSYELDLWQKVRASANVAAWEYQASAQDLATARLALINSVVDGYFQLAYLDEAMQLTRQSIDQYREIARIADSQYRHGKVASINPANAQQSLLGAEESLLSLQQSRNQLEQSLRNLLNLRPSDSLAINPIRLAALPATQVDLNVPLQVLANRPDLQAAEYRLHKAWSSQQVAQRSWYPSISLGAAVSASANDAQRVFSVPVGMGVVNLNLPFLDWQTLRWQNKQAEASFAAAKLDFEKTLTSVLNEVDGHYRQYQISRETLASAEQKYRYDQKSSRYHRVRYQQGVEELSDWLSAMNTELSSAQSLLNQRYTVLQRENLIYQAMAGRYAPR